jgi:hypothetical protein
MNTGWWLTYPSEKYEFVSWDDDIPFPNKWEKMFQTTNQYIYIQPCCCLVKDLKNMSSSAGGLGWKKNMF